MKYKLYIRQYDITTNDYKVREEIVETNDIYHEIGKIYSTAFTEIKRIDYEKIDETKELKQEIERLNNIIKEVREYIEERYNGEVLTHTFDKDNVEELLEILKGESNE